MFSKVDKYLIECKEWEYRSHTLYQRRFVFFLVEVGKFNSLRCAEEKMRQLIAKNSRKVVDFKYDKHGVFFS